MTSFSGPGKTGPAVEGPGSGIWPDPAAMHNYIDQWYAAYKRIADVLESERKLHEAQIADYVRQISELRSEIETHMIPLKTQISEQATVNRKLQSQLDALHSENNAVIQRLASILEVVPTRVTTLDSLVNNIVVLVDESKRQFRETIDHPVR